MNIRKFFKPMVHRNEINIYIIDTGHSIDDNMNFRKIKRNGYDIL